MSTLYYSDMSTYKYVVRKEPCVFDVPELAEFGPHDDDYMSLDEGKLTVFPGYAWDGCSGPTIDTKATRKPGLAHDAGYQLIRKQVLPPSAKPLVDAVLRRIMHEEGLKIAASRSFAAWRWAAGKWSAIRSSYYHWAVEHFGDPSTEPKAQEAQEIILSV